MIDLRETIREADPELHAAVRRWADAEGARYAADKLAQARKRRHSPPAGDHHARTAVGGLASVLLHHRVSGWLTRDLSHCWSESRLLVPLDEAEVDRLVDIAARRERRRRDAA